MDRFEAMSMLVTVTETGKPVGRSTGLKGAAGDAEPQNYGP